MTFGVIALVAALGAADAGVLLSRPATINAKHMGATGANNTVEYSGSVVVVRDTMTMTCDRLIAELGTDRQIERLLARGNVEVNDRDRWARGDEADYDHRTAVLVVRGNPRARQGKRDVEGSFVTFTNDSQHVVVKNAKTRLEQTTDAGAIDKIAIDADLLDLDDRQSTAVWSGHVRARRGDTTLVAPVMTAQYDQGGDVTKVEARGGVEATKGTKWARGQKADYDAKSGVLVVTGNPEARDGANRMRGTKFIFYQAKDIIEGENVTSIIEVDRAKNTPTKPKARP